MVSQYDEAGWRICHWDRTSNEFVRRFELNSATAVEYMQYVQILDGQPCLSTT